MKCLFLTSRHGGDYLALETARAHGVVDYDVCGVYSVAPDGPAVAHARAQGHPVHHLDKACLGRIGLGETLSDLFARMDFDLCVLAGFPYLLPEDAVQRHPKKIINSHHSILPANPGLYRKEKLVESDNKLLGATVHLVDEGVDTGEIICQAVFPNYGMEAFESILAQYRAVQDVLMVTAFRICSGHGFKSRQPIVRDTVFWPAPEESDVYLFMGE